MDFIFGMIVIFNPNTAPENSISITSIICVYSPQHMLADEMKI